MFPFIPTVEMPINYKPATGNAIATFGAEKVAEKMVAEEAINISGYSAPNVKKPSVLGRTGTAALAYSAASIGQLGGNRYYYAVGYVVMKDAAGNIQGVRTGAIWATKNEPNHSFNSSNP